MSSSRKPRTQRDFTRQEAKQLHDIVISVLAEQLGITKRAAQKLFKSTAKSDHTAEANELPSPLELYRDERRFLQRGFRIARTNRRSRHRIGGKRQSPGPKCSICKTPLLLFVDFDMQDKRLRGEQALTRLPLYYCCSCPGPVYYKVSRNGRVRTLPAKPERYDECPFQSPPTISSGNLVLREIRNDVEEAIFLAAKCGQFDGLTVDQLQQITRIIGSEPRGRWELYFSQFGGVPISYQGEEGKPTRCPNRECKSRRRSKAEFGYRPLAVLDLWQDRFWGGTPTDAVQIVFHICPACFTVAAKYTCT